MEREVIETDRYIQYIFKEDNMEIKEAHGQVAEISEKLNKNKEVYYSVKINGSTFNFNDKPTLGTSIKIKYTETEYTLADGSKAVSKWVQSFEVVESPQTTSDSEVEGEFKSAAKMTKAVDSSDLKKKMVNCILDAHEVLKRVNELADDTQEWTHEDIRTVGVSMFIEKNRRGE